MVQNKKKETEAGIYLRKGSQLVQGSTSTNKNKGTGSISVFQKGTSNAFDYNYWSMPVTINPGYSKLSDYLYGPVSNTNSHNANLVSGIDGKSDPLSISSNWLYTFSGTNYSNWAFIGDHFDLLPGEGFTMKGVNGINLNEIEEHAINKGNSQTYDFRGSPNDGTIELPIKKDQVLLIGNPYPSGFKLDEFLLENTSTTGIAYFWDSRENGNSHYLADYEGGYGTYSPGTGMYVPAVFKKFVDGSETGETGVYYERKISPIAQGFMVIGKNDGSVIFRNSHRIFQKEDITNSIFKAPVSDKSSFNLHIEINAAYIQKLALVFDERSSSEEDHAFDARKMDTNPENIAWSIADEAYVINVRPRIDQELIPLRISLVKNAELNLSISDLVNFNPDRMFIYDSSDDLYFSIKTGSLKFDLEPGEYNERFYLSFIEKIPPVNSENISPEQKPLSAKPENVLLNTIDIFQNNAEQLLEVKILYQSQISQIWLYDLNGKLYFQQNFKTGEKEFKFPTGNLSNAIYIVKVNTTDNIELTKKISVKN